MNKIKSRCSESPNQHEVSSFLCLSTILAAFMLLAHSAGCTFNPLGSGKGDNHRDPPNTDPQPTVGACCFGDGSCEQRPKYVCAATGGSYAGHGTNCDDHPCPFGLVDNAMQVGACCYGDADGLGCVVVTVFECDSTFLGIGTECPASGNCDDVLGACCNTADGSCAQTIEENCDAEGQVFQGSGTSCEVDGCAMSGACCEGDQCISLTEEDCLSVGGEFGGEGVACEAISCTTMGACCSFDQCVSTTEDVCLSVGGTFLGNGVECEATTCAPTGACLLALGLQCIITTEEECDQQGGFYTGDDTPCP